MVASALHPSVFDHPVTRYMASTPEVAHPDTPVADIAAMLDAHRISGVPIVDPMHHVLGVVTRTDLLALGALQGGRRPATPAMPLPHRIAAEVMTREPVSVPVIATIRDAARAMATHGIHRVLVLEHGVLVGVCSAVDIAAAVHDAHVAFELSGIMTSPLVTVTPRATLGTAIDLLDRLRITALVVLDDARPAGVFTQLEALAARDLPRSTPIEDLYDSSVECLASTAPLWMAAGQVARRDVRRVIVCKDHAPIGVVTALDFARWVAW